MSMSENIFECWFLTHILFQTRSLLNYCICQTGQPVSLWRFCCLDLPSHCRYTGLQMCSTSTGFTWVLGSPNTSPHVFFSKSFIHQDIPTPFQCWRSSPRHGNANQAGNTLNYISSTILNYIKSLLIINKTENCLLNTYTIDKSCSYEESHGL